MALKLPKDAKTSNDMRREAEYAVVSRLYLRFAKLSQRRFVFLRTLRYRMLLRKIRKAMGKD